MWKKVGDTQQYIYSEKLKLEGIWWILYSTISSKQFPRVKINIIKKKFLYFFYSKVAQFLKWYMTFVPPLYIHVQNLSMYTYIHNTYIHTHIDMHIYKYEWVKQKNICIYCYATMCSVGLQGAICSCQVHQLKQGTHVGCGFSMLFNITDITNSLGEPHFKATWWVLGELLKFNTANCLAFPLKYKAFHEYNTSTTKKKDSELPCLG